MSKKGQNVFPAQSPLMFPSPTQHDSQTALYEALQGPGLALDSNQSHLPLHELHPLLLSVPAGSGQTHKTYSCHSCPSTFALIVSFA